MEDKIAKLKSYNVFLNAELYTWDYIGDDVRRVGEIIKRQNEICDEFCQCVKDILEETPNENNISVEREVYIYVLQIGIKLCEEGERLFSDTNGLQKLFHLGNDYVKADKLKPEVFLKRLYQADYPYKFLASMQGYMAAQIKATLDKEVICKSRECCNLLKNMAQTYNQMWSKCVKRHRDFFSHPSEEFWKVNRRNYEIILEGLPEKTIRKLDESSWKMN